MLSLDQWKKIRRVDHLTVPTFSFRRGFYKSHPRFRDPKNRPDLKQFDQHVEAFHAAGGLQASTFDQVNHLASIIRTAANFVAVREKDDRYDKAVNTLHNAALLEIGKICGHAYQRDMENYITGTARPSRTIRIHLIAVTPPGEGIPATLAGKIADHILAGNACHGFQSGGLRIALANRGLDHLTNYGGGPVLCAPDAPINMRGKFLEISELSGGRLISYCNSLANANGASTVDVVYVPDFAGDDTGGLTLRTTVTWGGARALRPIVVVNANPSRALQARGGLETTLAHELCHAISSCGNHARAPDNLMAGGNDRVAGGHLNPGQCAWLCSNPWVT